MPGNLTRINESSTLQRIGHTSCTTARICRSIPDSCVPTIAQEMGLFLSISIRRYMAMPERLCRSKTAPETDLEANLNWAAPSCRICCERSATTETIGTPDSSLLLLLLFCCWGVSLIELRCRYIRGSSEYWQSYCGA
jgi:hypothetical protein